MRNSKTSSAERKHVDTPEHRRLCEICQLKHELAQARAALDKYSEEDILLSWKADAERYRWLRGNRLYAEQILVRYRLTEVSTDVSNFDSFIDAAIDAAQAKERK